MGGSICLQRSRPCVPLACFPEGTVQAHLQHLIRPSFTAASGSASLGTLQSITVNSITTHLAHAAFMHTPRLSRYVATCPTGNA